MTLEWRRIEVKFAVFSSRTRSGIQAYSVCVQLGTGQLIPLRQCSEMVDAEYIRELLQDGVIQPQDAANYRVPSWGTVGEEVETVGQMHRRLRR